MRHGRRRRVGALRARVPAAALSDRRRDGPDRRRERARGFALRRSVRCRQSRDRSSIPVSLFSRPEQPRDVAARGLVAAVRRSRAGRPAPRRTAGPGVAAGYRGARAVRGPRARPRPASAPGCARACGRRLGDARPAPAAVLLRAGAHAGGDRAADARVRGDRLAPPRADTPDDPRRGGAPAAGDRPDGRANRPRRGDGHGRRRPDGRADDPRRRLPPQGIAGRSFSARRRRHDRRIPARPVDRRPAPPDAQPRPGAGDGRRLPGRRDRRGLARREATRRGARARANPCRRLRAVSGAHGHLRESRGRICPARDPDDDSENRRRPTRDGRGGCGWSPWPRPPPFS